MTAQEKELMMYVAEDATYATGNQAIFKASDFVGATCVDSTNTIFRFYFVNTKILWLYFNLTYLL